MLNQTFHAAQTGRARKNFQARQARPRPRLRPPRISNESIPPNALICFFATSCARMRRQARDNAREFDAWVIVKISAPTSARFPNARASATAVCAFRAGPASNRMVRARRRRNVCICAHALEKFIVLFRDNDPTDDIAMAAEIFRGRMHDEIGAEIERSLNDRRPGVVANAERAACVHDFGDGREVDNLQKRIRRRLHPDQFRLRPQRVFTASESLMSTKLGFQSPAQK